MSMMESSLVPLPQPLNLSTSRNLRSRKVSNRDLKSNFLYSDTNPVCVQLYLEAVGKLTGRPHLRLPTPDGVHRLDKRIMKRSLDRNWSAQERCREFWVRAKLYRLKQRQVALQARIQQLMDTKLICMRKVHYLCQLFHEENRPAWLNDILSAVRSI